jgi:hypothetical protein
MTDFRPPISVLKHQRVRQPRVTYPLWALVACAIMVAFAGGLFAATLLRGWL